MYALRRGVAVALSAAFSVSAPHALAEGQVVRLEDHSLPKAKVRTFHANCASKRFVVIRVDPANPQICGASQDTDSHRVCVPRAAASQVEDTVRQLASQLCR
jgi:hypothetical protein